MAFTGIELARVKKVVGGFCEGWPRPEIRGKLRLEYSVVRHDVELFEVRSHWREPGREMRTPVAKLRFVRSAGEWRLFWMRQDLKWHAYEPCASSRRLDASSLLSGAKAAIEMDTKNGFSRRSAWVTALAFSDISHPQWVEGENGLI
jgi:hypothetical protein